MPDIELIYMQRAGRVNSVDQTKSSEPVDAKPVKVYKSSYAIYQLVRKWGKNKSCVVCAGVEKCNAKRLALFSDFISTMLWVSCITELDCLV